MGFALASEFLSLADGVVIAARNGSSCKAAVQELQQQYPQGQVFQTVCDVTQPDQLQQLTAFAQEKLGRIDIWVNNAGSSQIPKASLAETVPDQIQQIVGTNLLGSLLGSQAAIQVMQKQPTGNTTALQCTSLEGMLHSDVVCKVMLAASQLKDFALASDACLMSVEVKPA